ncbi:MAG: hypothetical protein GY793_04195 [Proteobacteria bacterium]|nr:hypothetical protein [Pseudomonadota bacterium]
MGEIKLGTNFYRRERSETFSFRAVYREFRKAKGWQAFLVFIFYIIYTAERPFELKKRELDSLINEMESILNRKLGADFIKNIDSVIISARLEIEKNQKVLNKKETTRYITKVRNNAKNLLNSLEFPDKYSMLKYSVSRSDDFLDMPGKSLVDITIQNLGTIIENCNKAEEKAKLSKIDKLKITTIRQMVAENLAMYFVVEGIKPTKYDNGEYMKCLKVLLENISYKDEDKIINMYVPDDIRDIAIKAIDNHDKKGENFTLFIH